MSRCESVVRLHGARSWEYCATETARRMVSSLCADSACDNGSDNNIDDLGSFAQRYGRQHQEQYYRIKTVVLAVLTLLGRHSTGNHAASLIVAT